MKGKLCITVSLGMLLALHALSGVIAIDTTGEGYRLPPADSSKLINEHGLCKQVLNQGTSTYFIPTKTAGEWQSFVSSMGSLGGISHQECCTPYSWTTYDTYCPASCPPYYECGWVSGYEVKKQRRRFIDCTMEYREISTDDYCGESCGYCGGGESCVGHTCEYVSCFVSGTKVTMADGSQKNIEDVVIGEQLMSYSGSRNFVYEYDRPLIGGRSTYIINGEIEFTGEHPFLSTEGWKVANLDEFHAVPNMIGEEPTLFEVGDILITDNGEVEIETFETVRVRPSDEMVYNFKLTGDGTYFANGYVVHNK